MSAIHIHPETKQRLTELSHSTGKTVADLVQEALEHYLERGDGREEGGTSDSGGLEQSSSASSM